MPIAQGSMSCAMSLEPRRTASRSQWVEIRLFDVSPQQSKLQLNGIERHGTNHRFAGIPPHIRPPTIDLGHALLAVASDLTALDRQFVLVGGLAASLHSTWVSCAPIYSSLKSAGSRGRILRRNSSQCWLP